MDSHCPLIFSCYMHTTIKQQLIHVQIEIPTLFCWRKLFFFYFRKSLYDQLTTNRQVSKKHMFLKKSVHLVCTNYADLTDEKKFIQMAPSGNVSMHCPLGTAFVAADCGCTKFIEILPSSNLDGRRRLPLSFISLT